MIYEWQHIALFLTAAFALNLSPGPDLMYVLSSTLSNGRRVGFAAAFGIAAGALVHVFAAAFGLSAILQTSLWAFLVVKYVGAAYLIYLGIKAIRGAGNLDLRLDGIRIGPMQAFRQGVLIDMMNPKAAIFFLAFLPQFVVPTVGYVPLQMIALGVVTILIGLLVECLAVVGAATMTSALRRKPKVALWLDRLFGTVLVGLGIRLALQPQS